MMEEEQRRTDGEEGGVDGIGFNVDSLEVDDEVFSILNTLDEVEFEFEEEEKGKGEEDARASTAAAGPSRRDPRLARSEKPQPPNKPKPGESLSKAVEKILKEMEEAKLTKELSTLWNLAPRGVPKTHSQPLPAPPLPPAALGVPTSTTTPSLAPSPAPAPAPAPATASTSTCVAEVQDKSKGEKADWEPCKKVASTNTLQEKRKILNNFDVVKIRDQLTKVLGQSGKEPLGGVTDVKGICEEVKKHMKIMVADRKKEEEGPSVDSTSGTNLTTATPPATDERKALLFAIEKHLIKEKEKLIKSVKTDARAKKADEPTNAVTETAEVEDQTMVNLNKRKRKKKNKKRKRRRKRAGGGDADDCSSSSFSSSSSLSTSSSPTPAEHILEDSKANLLKALAFKVVQDALEKSAKAEKDTEKGQQPSQAEKTIGRGGSPAGDDGDELFPTLTDLIESDKKADVEETLFEPLLITPPPPVISKPSPEKNKKSKDKDKEKEKDKDDTKKKKKMASTSVDTQTDRSTLQLQSAVVVPKGRGKDGSLSPISSESSSYASSISLSSFEGEGSKRLVVKKKRRRDDGDHHHRRYKKKSSKAKKKRYSDRRSRSTKDRRRSEEKRGRRTRSRSRSRSPQKKRILSLKPGDHTFEIRKRPLVDVGRRPSMKEGILQHVEREIEAPPPPIISKSEAPPSKSSSEVEEGELPMEDEEDCSRPEESAPPLAEAPALVCTAAPSIPLTIPPAQTVPYKVVYHPRFPFPIKVPMTLTTALEAHAASMLYKNFNRLPLPQPQLPDSGSTCTSSGQATTASVKEKKGESPARRGSLLKDTEDVSDEDFTNSPKQDESVEVGNGDNVRSVFLDSPRSGPLSGLKISVANTQPSTSQAIVETDFKKQAVPPGNLKDSNVPADSAPSVQTASSVSVAETINRKKEETHSSAIATTPVERCEPAQVLKEVKELEIKTDKSNQTCKEPKTSSDAQEKKRAIQDSNMKDDPLKKQSEKKAPKPEGDPPKRKSVEKREPIIPSAANSNKNFTTGKQSEKKDTKVPRENLQKSCADDQEKKSKSCPPAKEDDRRNSKELENGPKKDSARSEELKGRIRDKKKPPKEGNVGKSVSETTKDGSKIPKSETSKSMDIKNCSDNGGTIEKKIVNKRISDAKEEVRKGSGIETNPKREEEIQKGQHLSEGKGGKLHKTDGKSETVCLDKPKADESLNSSKDTKKKDTGTSRHKVRDPNPTKVKSLVDTANRKTQSVKVEYVEKRERSVEAKDGGTVKEVVKRNKEEEGGKKMDAGPTKRLKRRIDEEGKEKKKKIDVTKKELSSNREEDRLSKMKRKVAAPVDEVHAKQSKPETGNDGLEKDEVDGGIKQRKLQGEAVRKRKVGKFVLKVSGEVESGDFISFGPFAGGGSLILRGPQDEGEEDKVVRRTCRPRQVKHRNPAPEVADPLTPSPGRKTRSSARLSRNESSSAERPEAEASPDRKETHCLPAKVEDIKKEDTFGEYLSDPAGFLLEPIKVKEEEEDAMLKLMMIDALARGGEEEELKKAVATAPLFPADDCQTLLKSVDKGVGTQERSEKAIVGVEDAKSAALEILEILSERPIIGPKNHQRSQGSCDFDDVQSNDSASSFNQLITDICGSLDIAAPGEVRTRSPLSEDPYVGPPLEEMVVQTLVALKTLPKVPEAVRVGSKQPAVLKSFAYDDCGTEGNIESFEDLLKKENRRRSANVKGDVEPGLQPAATASSIATDSLSGSLLESDLIEGTEVKSESEKQAVDDKAGGAQEERSAEALPIETSEQQPPPLSGGDDEVDGAEVEGLNYKDATVAKKSPPKKKGKKKKLNISVDWLKPPTEREITESPKQVERTTETAVFEFTGEEDAEPLQELPFRCRRRSRPQEREGTEEAGEELVGIGTRTRTRMTRSPHLQIQTESKANVSKGKKKGRKEQTPSPSFGYDVLPVDPDPVRVWNKIRSFLDSQQRDVGTNVNTVNSGLVGYESFETKIPKPVTDLDSLIKILIEARDKISQSTECSTSDAN